MVTEKVVKRSMPVAKGTNHDQVVLKAMISYHKSNLFVKNGLGFEGGEGENHITTEAHFMGSGRTKITLQLKFTQK